MNKPVVTIDIISDVVCPWCYIGKRRLEKAVDKLKDQFDFKLQYHPYELNPTMPKEGYGQKAYLSNKFGGEERYEEITAHTTEVAAEEGLNFNFSIQKKSPNTFDSHRVIWLAGHKGKQLETFDLFFQAYFEKGVDLTDKENLIAIAEAAGLEEAEVRALLNSEEGVKEVREQEDHNYQIGVKGVPFYIINKKYAVSGAQPTEVFVEALSDIASKDAVQGESCDVSGNC